MRYHSYVFLILTDKLLVQLLARLALAVLALLQVRQVVDATVAEGAVCFGADGHALNTKDDERHYSQSHQYPGVSLIMALAACWP